MCVIGRFSRVRFCGTLRTVARQAPLPMEFSRQEYWSGLPFLLPGDLPRDRTRVSCLLHWQVGSLPLAPPGVILGAEIGGTVGTKPFSRLVFIFQSCLSPRVSISLGLICSGYPFEHLLILAPWRTNSSLHFITVFMLQF